jgi:TRAP-type transport system periplasmic protein
MQRINRRFLTLGIFLLTLSLLGNLVLSCSGSTSSPAPASSAKAPPPASTQSAAVPSSASPASAPSSSPASAKVIELKFTHHIPPTTPEHKQFERWVQKIQDATNGRVKITIYPAESLVKGVDSFSSIVAGVTDIGFVSQSYEPTKLAFNFIINLGALYVPISSKGLQLWDQYLSRFPQATAELKDTHNMFRTIGSAYSLHTVKKAVRVPEDMKGMKITVTGLNGNIVKEAGGTPVDLPSGEWYMALERGVVEGAFAPVGVLASRGAEALTPYHLDLNMAQAGFHTLMNLNKWNSLPPDIQAKFDENSLWASEEYMKVGLQNVTDCWNKCNSYSKHVVKQPTPEEQKLWLALAQPMANKWIEDNKGKGPTADMFEWMKQQTANLK